MIDILKEIISTSDKNEITFEQYMSTVLYHPEMGYYMKEGEKVGKGGDFITSSNISNVYGRLFASLFHKLIEKEKIPPIICEIGGGNGRFAKAVLEELASNYSDTYKKLTYMIIETSPYHQKLQRDILPIGEKVVQYSSLEEAKQKIITFNGILFSNELFDAFPVRVIEKKKNMILEVKVSLDSQNHLQETLSPLTDEKILNYLDTNNISLVNGQRFEVPIAMLQYLEEMESFIESGIIITVDYGYTNEEWAEPAHKNGSLRGYYQHQLVNNPLLHPGEMDLTTHIHFDTLINYGTMLGFEFQRKMRQDEFLLAAGILEFLQENYDPNPFSERSKQNRAIRSLIMDGSMSSSFHVIIQQKEQEIDWATILDK